MLTGAIIGMARALGETAPLLMIGMVAFIVDIPSGPFDPATALPVQIYLWVDSPERAFVERTSAAIMLLLAFLMYGPFASHGLHAAEIAINVYEPRGISDSQAQNIMGFCQTIGLVSSITQDGGVTTFVACTGSMDLGDISK